MLKFPRKINITVRRFFLLIFACTLLQVFLAISYFSYSSYCEQDYLTELDFFNNILNKLNVYVFLFDKNLLSLYTESSLHTCYNCDKSLFVFGINSRYVENNALKKIVQYMDTASFITVLFYNNNFQKLTSGDEKLPIALVIRKKCLYVFHFLYSREENSWWFGNLQNDEHFQKKLRYFPLWNTNPLNDFHEGFLNKFETVRLNMHGGKLNYFLRPKNENKFFKDFENSHFIECNQSRANSFRKMYGVDKSPKAQLFRHRAWKILSKAKTILDRLSITFWLSSGTCLGFYRECDIIAHSKDVDIGIFAKDYSDSIVPNMQKHGLILKHKFGQHNDSLELSFIDRAGVKLDIFFFYLEENNIWNGGTEKRSGKKFKYTFPKFELCWTLFCSLKVRIPCQTESYILANYGPKWFTPIKNWNWKSSPPNVKENGVWPRVKI